MNQIVKKAYVNLSDGNQQEIGIHWSQKEVGSVQAVFVDVMTDSPLNGDDAVRLDLSLKNAIHWMADYRYSEYWCRPAFGSDWSSLPDDTQGLIYQKDDGKFGVILPVVSAEYKCVLCGVDGRAEAKLFSWYDGLTECRALAFLWGEGDSPYSLLTECAKQGLELLHNGCRTRDQRRYPELFEYLGWCSWDAFEIRLSEEGLQEKCDEFQTKSIPIRWVILDDMWAEIRDFYGRHYQTREEMFDLMHSSRLYSFEADPIRFPHGLKTAIDQLHKHGLKVGIWHPATGYWKGLDPSGDVYDRYKDLLIQEENGSFVPDYREDKAYAFFSAFHDYLRQCGADFVKIDNQSMTRRFYKKLAPVGNVSRQFHNAIESSVGRHFDNQMINCMGMASEDMWNRSVSPISRCSDDFQPENKTWFTKHVLQCAYNCLIQGQFYTCDWDMWWTDDGQAVKNSLLRAVSGGPIYISDKLNRSRKEVLMPLILHDGKILRCDRPGMPSIDCLISDPRTSRKIFKIQNVCGHGGVILALNLDTNGSEVSGTISPSDIEGLIGEQFAVYEHFSRAFRVMNRNETFSITLSSDENYRLYVVVPMTNGRAAIGRTDKYISPKTICFNCLGGAELIENGPYAYVEKGEINFKQEWDGISF